MKEDYKKKLRHIQPKGYVFFVTFRLYGSIPKVEVDRLKDKYRYKIERIENQKLDKKERNILKFNLRKQYLDKYDKLLHKIKSGPSYFKDKEIMDIMKKQLHRFDGDLYEMISYSIMSNHVHILIDTSIQLNEGKESGSLIKKYTFLDEIMKRIKGPTAIYANRVLGVKGQFWDRESFDIYIRNDKMLNRVVTYILNNPVKAGIVDDWELYPGNYLKA